jgi:drug/metabolite transporter (DMT)-like permease
MGTPFTYAMLAAMAFGLGVPLSKALLDDIAPALLAGLLYFGAALALFVFQRLSRVLDPETKYAEAPVRRADLPWLALALLAGGVGGPLLLLYGLDGTDAGTASVLLSLEAVFTVSIAVAFLTESVSIRMLLGMMTVSGAALTLSLHQSSEWGLSLGAVGVAGATFCWAIDNNATGKISLKDPATIVIWKGLVAGAVNTLIAVALGVPRPAWLSIAAALGVGAVGYGVSLIFFIRALRGLGSARTTTLFGSAPFFGAALSALMFYESRSLVLLPAGLAAAAGTWLLAGERHEHQHEHPEMTHEHRHVHDEHHRHNHEGERIAEPHSHPHTHRGLRHSHAHVPDIHHRH